MLKKRIIPVLTVINDRLVKSINFNKLIDVGDPIKTAKIFNDSDADELIILNINRNNRSIFEIRNLIEKICENCFMPISVGGGINNFNDAKTLFNSGADKVIINSSFYNNKELIREISHNYGGTSIVMSLDLKRNNNLYQLYSNCGRVKEDIDIKEYISMVEEIGVGELFVNSIDQDGSMKGYDLNLIKMMSNNTKIPIIACGGVGNVNHIKEAFLCCNLSAAACGSLFNFGDNNPIRVKNFLTNYNLDFKLIDQ